MPKDTVGNLHLKNRCGTRSWYISNIVFCRENCNISLICIITRLYPTCIILSFAYVSDKLHLVSSLLQQPWRSPHLEELCSPSFSLASKDAYRKKEPACNWWDLQPQKNYLSGQEAWLCCMLICGSQCDYCFACKKFRGEDTEVLDSGSVSWTINTQLPVHQMKSIRISRLIHDTAEQWVC